MPSTQGNAAKRRAALEAVFHAQKRYDTRLTQSWQYENNVKREPGDDTERIRADLGLSYGLSYGLYRAVPFPNINIKNKVPPETGPDNYLNKTLKATYLLRPGTVKVKVSGLRAAPHKITGSRGIITELSKGAKRRVREFTRECEALGYKPDVMGSLTMGRNWRADMSSRYEKTASALKVLWKRLDGMKAQATQYRKEYLSGHVNRIAYETYFLPRYERLRRIVKKLIHRYKRTAVDGRRIKAWMNAFLKRFDRAYGIIVQHKDLPLECAQTVAAMYEGKFCKVAVKKMRYSERYQVEITRYRLAWWLEFQSRGAPHLHLMFFDTKGLPWKEIQQWAGPEWTAIVQGVWNVKPYLSGELRAQREQLLEAWGSDVGKQLFEGVLLERKLSARVWDHIQAGTSFDAMEVDHWGYMEAEVLKAYQKKVPKRYQNVGRWWGYRKYKRAPTYHLTYSLDSEESVQETLVKPLQAALATLPNYFPKVNRRTGQTEEAYCGFKPKVARAAQAIANREDTAYLTLWKQPAVNAVLSSLGAEPPWEVNVCRTRDQGLEKLRTEPSFWRRRHRTARHRTSRPSSTASTVGG